MIYTCARCGKDFFHSDYKNVKRVCYDFCIVNPNSWVWFLANLSVFNEYYLCDVCTEKTGIEKLFHKEEKI